MSSILDALRKLEEAEAPAPREPARVRERPRRIGLTAAGIALAFGAGAFATDGGPVHGRRLGRLELLQRIEDRAHDDAPSVGRG